MANVFPFKFLTVKSGINKETGGRDGGGRGEDAEILIVSEQDGHEVISKLVFSLLFFFVVN